MHCYWEGEARLGSLNGVVQTRAGWLKGNEVVEIIYDQHVISYDELLKHAQKMSCASRVFAHTNDQLEVAENRVGKRAEIVNKLARDANDSDQKFALKRTPLQYLPMTPLQATKINAELRLGGKAEKWLSPRQLSLLRTIKKASKANPKLLANLKRPKEPRGLQAYQEKLINKLNASGFSVL